MTTTTFSARLECHLNWLLLMGTQLGGQQCVQFCLNTSATNKNTRANTSSAGQERANGKRTGHRHPPVVGGGGAGCSNSFNTAATRTTSRQTFQLDSKLSASFTLFSICISRVHCIAVKARAASPEFVQSFHGGKLAVVVGPCLFGREGNLDKLANKLRTAELIGRDRADGERYQAN